MNVLVTCAGRRGYLVRSFQAAVGDAGSVFAADAAQEAPALQAADEAFIVPRVEDPGYVDRLLEICDERSVDLLISLNDLELPLIAWNRERFHADRHRARDLVPRDRADLLRQVGDGAVPPRA